MGKITLYIRAFFSMIHIAFVKLFHINTLHVAFMQDFAPSVKLYPHDGGSIYIKPRVHARRNVIIEAEGGIVSIGEGCFFNNGVMIVAKDSVSIDEYTSFGPNVLVYDHDHSVDNGKAIRESGYKTEPVIIGKNVWIGANSVILRGTVIGDNSVIGAGSVIKGNYPQNSVIVQKRQSTVSLRKGGSEQLV